MNGNAEIPLIGQPLAAEILDRAIRSDSISQAYLFYGPAGIGKRCAALLFAAAAECRAHPDDPHLQIAACGTCESCRWIRAGSHPDVIEVRPDSESGQNITVRQAAAIVSNVALRPKAAARRFFVVPRAELLSEDAANALLKTLEEPGNYATLILCAPGLGNVLPTIASRCQPIRFELVPTTVIVSALITHLGAEVETAQIAAAAAGGRPGLAVRAITDPKEEETRNSVLTLTLEALDVGRRCQSDPKQAVTALRLADHLRGIAQARRQTDLDAEKKGVSGCDPAGPLKHYIRSLLHIGEAVIRDILVLCVGGDVRCVQNVDRIASLEQQSVDLELENGVRILDLFLETEQLLERNVSPQLALERLFLNVCLVTPTR